MSLRCIWQRRCKCLDLRDLFTLRDITYTVLTRLQKFEVQLAPLVKELHKDAELVFVNGPVTAVPPAGFEDFFGVGPYFRFIEPPKADTGTEDLLDRIRKFPKGATAEDQMRELMRGGFASVDVDDYYRENKSAAYALEYLYDIMEQQGPFDGIIGYSEGATIAATLLLHEQRRFEETGKPTMFKCALFFAGWPPLTPELDSLVLADESDLMITIPTVHISMCPGPALALHLLTKHL